MPIAAAIPAIIGVAGSVGVALIGANAAKRASAAQAAAANRGIDTQLAMYADAKANLQPFTDLGKAASYSLADLYGLPTPQNPNGGQSFNSAALANFTNSASYQFPYQQGLKTLENTAAAKGGLLSGNQLAAATRYGTDYAAGQLGAYVGELDSMANRGENAGAQSGQLGINAGQGIATTQGAVGQAQAAGIMGQSAALSNLFGQPMMNSLSQLFAQTYGSPSAYASTNNNSYPNAASPATYTGYAMGP